MKKILLTLTAVFCSACAFGQTQYVNPEGLSKPNGYTHVVVTTPGKLVFISGQVANNAKGELVGKDDLRAQTKQIFENLKAAVTAAGGSLNDIVKITWYVKGYSPANLSTLREVRDMYVSKENPPASTLVGVSSLFREEYLLEVDAVAVVGKR